MDSRKQRKFHPWDNKLLYETLKKAIQITHTVESKCDEYTSPDMLPLSLMPTDVLYDICSCFEDMYLKLEQHELLVMGHQHQAKTAH